MKFDATDSTVSLNPMDFNYEFGMNDNSESYFNYNSISLFTNAMTSINQQNLSTSFSGSFIDGSNMLMNPFNDNVVVGYEVSQSSINTIDYTPTLDFNKLDTLSTKYDMSNLYTSIINTTFSTLNNMINTIGLSDKALDKGAGIQDAISQAFNFGLNVYSAYQNVANAIDSYERNKELVNKKIELYNEKADANREFVSQCKEAIKARQDRFQKANSYLKSSSKK